LSDIEMPGRTQQSLATFFLSRKERRLKKRSGRKRKRWKRWIRERRRNWAANPHWD